MSGPYFETWSHENLAKFARSCYLRLQQQDEELQRLRQQRPATREEKIVNPGVYERNKDD